jgi:transcription elongation factor B subunit 1
MDKNVAIEGSQTMQAMLEGGNFRESENNIVRFPDISGSVLEKIIQYLYYKAKHKRTSGKLPEFEIEPEIALELMIASNFLNC